MIKALIFDFDGTIADSFEIFVESLETVLNRPPFSDKEVADMRKLSVRETAKYLGLKRWQLPKFAVKGKQEITKRINRVEVFKDMPEVIKTVHDQGYKIFILSTNSEANIKMILNKNNLNQFVDSIYAGIHLQKKYKSLKKFVKNENLLPAECIYIGDEVRDVDAARKAGMKCVAVAWGYSNPSALKARKPNAIVNKPSELTYALKNLK